MKKINKEFLDLIDKFTYRVEWSEADGIHIAYCLELPSVKAHHKTIEGAIKELKAPLETSLNWMKEDGQELPEPIGTREYKGSLTLRVPPEVHKKLAMKSAEEGVSINHYILSKLG